MIFKLENVFSENMICLFKSLVLVKPLYKVLLFVGIEGSGKKMAALAVAAAYNCLEGMFSNNKNFDWQISDNEIACSCCDSCKDIFSGVHPDVIHIGSLKSAVITVNDVRAILNIGIMKPYKARCRVIIMENAGRMNLEASNAFLRFLEEPPKNTFLILTVLSRTDLVDTVLSRCQSIFFAPFTIKAIKNIVSNYGISNDLITDAVNLSEGSFVKAIKLTKYKWAKRRRWLIFVMSSLYSFQSNGTEEVWSWMLFSELLSREHDMVEWSLEVIKTWLRDVLICSVDFSKVINIDVKDEIIECSRFLNPKIILFQIESVQKAQDNLRLNGNLRLTLDLMVIHMMTWLK